MAQKRPSEDAAHANSKIAFLRGIPVKFIEIYLTAYGSFTELTFDFSAGSQGLHFILGANEAGKSTALRGIKNLLYGIPQRCPDDFLHPYAKMRVGAKICSKDGDTLAFLRRKGRSNTLRAPDDKTVVDDAELDRFLRGVDIDLFSSLFGIDYQELNRGGAEIISGGGNLGKLLFAAGSGISDLNRTMKELQEQSDLLFKKSAQKPAINAAVAGIQANQKALREAQLPGRKWNEHDQALKSAQARMTAVEQNLTKKHRELKHLERIASSLPIIAQRKELLKALAGVSDAVVLPPDFSKKRNELSTALNVAHSVYEQSFQRVEVLKGEIEAYEIHEELLALEKEVDNFYRELGSLQKADKDRIQLKTRRSALMAEGKESLKKLGRDLDIDKVDALRIQKADIILIHELGTTYERLNTQYNSVTEELERMARLLADNQAQKRIMPTPRDMDALKNALEQAEEYSTYDSYCREENSKIKAAFIALRTKVERLGLWSGSPDDLERLQLPAIETISAAESRLESIHRQLERATEKFEASSERLQSIEIEIHSLQLDQGVPTSQDLHRIRAVREDGWQILRSVLENNPPNDESLKRYTDQFPGKSTLADAYESAVLQADRIADRLRQEADSVATLAKLSTEKTVLEAKLQNLEEEINVQKQFLKAARKDWESLWQPIGISPRSPKEMKSWVQQLRILADKTTELRERQHRVDQMMEDLDHQRRLLTPFLNTSDTDTSPASFSISAQIKQCRRLIKTEDEKKAAFERNKAEEIRLSEEVALKKSKVARLTDELSKWRVQWGKAMQMLGLDETALPRQANAVIDETQKLFNTLKEAHILQQRIDGIGRDEEIFAQNVKQMVRQVAPDFGQMPASEAVMALHQQLTQARLSHSKRESQRQELTREHNRCVKNQEKIAEINARLNLLCQQAKCETYDELPIAESQSEERCRIEAKLSELEQRLRNLSAGAGVEEFVSEALGIDPDTIDQSIHTLKETIADLDLERGELNQTIGRERNELSKMDGSARAADLAEEIQLLLGSLQADVEKYARLKLAWVVLNRAMERFRDKNQGPILTLASRFFAELSCGSYCDLRADFNEKGEPVVVGVRPDGKELVGVAGMSAGTADQLYLSLRLAGLSDYLERNEPMPFIVDDILIQFDDDRAIAALKALGDLSQKTQVLFFSHHRHLLDLAQKNLPEAVLIPHHLSHT